MCTDVIFILTLCGAVFFNKKNSDIFNDKTAFYYFNIETDATICFAIYVDKLLN